MKLFSIEGNSQKLDGGPMFGNCPKAVWQNGRPRTSITASRSPAAR
jgi:hypothetical protein